MWVIKKHSQSNRCKQNLSEERVLSEYTHLDRRNTLGIVDGQGDLEQHKFSNGHDKSSLAVAETRRCYDAVNCELGHVYGCDAQVNKVRIITRYC